MYTNATNKLYNCSKVVGTLAIVFIALSTRATLTDELMCDCLSYHDLTSLKFLLINSQRNSQVAASFELEFI